MEEFKKYILDSEEILMEKVLQYAKKQDYVKYTSTLKEAWRLSISGLSEALIKVIDKSGAIPEMVPDEDFTHSEVAGFGIAEAKRHRTRGVTLGMFMGLLKYYQQSYADLIQESHFAADQKEYYLQYIKRFFDHVELGLIMEWKEMPEIQRITELQKANRQMTNEKNKYLTVFESIYDPIILMDKDNKIENINFKAAENFLDTAVSGMRYYSNTEIKLDWLNEQLRIFMDSDRNEILQEKTVQTKTGQKIFMVKFQKMLDISEKYKGTVVIFYDITERKKVEKELEIRNEMLEYYAYTDQMTGVSNRRTGIELLEKELVRISESYMPLSVCFFDVDGLKTVNDTYGHIEGDQMIKFIASAVKSSVREIDTVSRMGGDEFLVIFPGFHESEAEEIIKKINAKLEEHNQDREFPFEYSFSYGIIETRGGNYDANDVIKAADEKMYLNKLSKRTARK